MDEEEKDEEMATEDRDAEWDKRRLYLHFEKQNKDKYKKYSKEVREELINDLVESHMKGRHHGRMNSGFA